MTTTKTLCVSAILIGLLSSLCGDLFAGEPSRELIDKTNWKKVEGQVPEPLLEWVKNGDFILNVAELSYAPAEYWPSFVVEARRNNVGKYKLNEKNEIVDAGTGELAKFILAVPFPEIDPADPKAAIKIMYNKQYIPYTVGYKKFVNVASWVGRSGLEREVEVLFRDFYFTGFPGAKKYSNPRDMERYSILSVRKPYDLAGTSVLLWRYLSSKQDVNFSYVPAIRRVRRTTPANRSDGFLGSDFTQDDILAYDGKIPDFEWKLVGKQDVLVNFATPDPLAISKTEKGEWMITKDVKPIQYGYHDKDATVAPWCPINSIYTKRPAWVIEARSKDPYYNYGVQYIWVDAECWLPYYKVVHDRTGQFWKLVMIALVGLESADENMKMMAAMDHLIVDPRRGHATYLKELNPDCEFLFYADLDVNDFSLAGFQKYCK